MQNSAVADSYSQLASTRDPYLERARQAALLTIPAIFPPEGQGGAAKLVVPYQGTGSRAVKSLANKLLQALFPPNEPFFQMALDPESTDKLKDSTKGKVDDALRLIEQMAQQRFEQKAMRTPLYEAFKQLLIGGNSLVFLGNEKVKVYRLDKYVVERDGDGNTSRIIVKEQMRPADLPAELRDKPEVQSQAAQRKTVDLYTIVKRGDSKWTAHQECFGYVIEDSQSSYPKDRCPWIPLRMIQEEGEDYGRSYVEEHMGDLHSLEQLTKAVLEGSLAAARILFMVRPNGSTKIKELRNSKNGDFVQGQLDDVQPLQMNKYADFQVAANEIAKLERSLAQAFMMTQSVQRQAERVTAEEIRQLTAELEATLGGVYSLMATELQLPLVKVLIGRLEQSSVIPKLPKGVTPKILTGVDSLGRSAELQRLQVLFQMLQPLGPEVIAQKVKVDELILRVAAAVGLEPDGLVMSEEEQQQNQNQQQQQEMMQQMVPQMMQQGK